MTLNDNFKNYTESNRAAWNEVMPHHQKAAKEKWDLAFRQPGFVCLDQLEQERLQPIGIQGKDVVHLCCNNGVELLSLKNMGAGRCVGFDISDEAIREATERAAASGIDCQYVRSDVYEIDPQYQASFDLVYITIGCLGWLPDIKLFFQVAASLLRKGGQVFIYEAHPFSEIIPFDDDPRVVTLRIVDSYFKTDPYIDVGGLDYIGGATYEAHTTQYWFTHTLSQIITALIENSLALEHFSEYPHDIGAGHRQTEELNLGFPLSYIMVARKL
jgi:ubiquinone/menaquinone biosynthesis C-methylase UbiE